MRPLTFICTLNNALMDGVSIRVVSCQIEGLNLYNGDVLCVCYGCNYWICKIEEVQAIH